MRASPTNKPLHTPPHPRTHAQPLGGYTVWYHYVLLSCLLTSSPYLHRLAVIQGLTVSAGWYASQLYDYAVHGAIFEVL